MKNKITKGSMIVILYDCGTVMSVAVRKRGIIAPQFALCYHYSILDYICTRRYIQNYIHNFVHIKDDRKG